MKTLTKITFLAALGLFAQNAFAEITAEQAAWWCTFEMSHHRPSTTRICQ